MDSMRIAIVGGGAAGFFAALSCAESSPGARITIFEKSPRFLAKVRISGGGRCNVTHACFDPREFAERYPRGGRELLGAFQQFQAADTVEWFATRGVALKTEPDGRMFPVTDSSETILLCLLESAKAARIHLRTNCGVERVTRNPCQGFQLGLSGSGASREEIFPCDRLLLASGGCRTDAGGNLAMALGHTVEPPVPSLFTFQVSAPWLRELAGVTLECAEISVPGCGLRERGALLVTHGGLSGPVTLRLSAWGARKLHALDYRFPLRVNWLPHLTQSEVAAELEARRHSIAARQIANAPLARLPARLWEKLAESAGIPAGTRWAALSRAAQHRLVHGLTGTELAVDGKSLNKEEFVTCGGVRLGEVNFKTMESRICPGLFFAGELLDMDGVTGGFNFQAAWTTGWIAGRHLARQT